jgi:predicted secreted protein
MYTEDMRRAFHSITPPKGFKVQIIDNEHFLTIKLDEKQFAKMFHDEKIEALQYVIQVKKTLEMTGAIILITREPIK